MDGNNFQPVLIAALMLAGFAAGIALTYILNARRLKNAEGRKTAADEESPDLDRGLRGETDSEAQDSKSQALVGRGSQAPPPALYLRKLELENVRCFDELVLNFEQGQEISLRTAIIGDNAIGKSTVLRSIAIGLCNEGDAITLMKEIPGGMVRQGEREAIIRVHLTDPSGTDRLSLTSTVQRSSDGSEIVRQALRPKDFPWNSIFVCGYGTQRTAAASASFDSYSIRKAVSTLFDVQAVLQNPELVLLRQDQNLRELLQAKVLDVMLLDDGTGKIEEADSGLQVHGPWGTSRFDLLSDGYRSTTQWLLDLFAWLILAGRLNGHQPRGILLIDELEQHLHPSWQRFIIQRLSRQLPEMQIITTTHTPLVASGLADVESAAVFRLFKNTEGKTQAELIDSNSFDGKRADEMLTEFFDLSASRNPGSSDDLNRYVELSSRPSLTEAEKFEVAKLRKQFEPVLLFGETPLEQKVEQAVSSALDKLIREKPSVEFDLETKRQLHRLFSKPD